MSHRIAVLLPCRNEAPTIAAVVHDFRVAIPGCTVYVYDNDSSDATADEAGKAGAVVRAEPMPGKGNVVRRMFTDIEADVYVIADGDGTYDAGSAPAMVRRLIENRLDMVVGARVGDADDEARAFRRGHRAGNAMLTRWVGWLFESRLRDMLSGYRVLSRRFVKSFPALATGFEIETELTIHALELKLPIAEMALPYRARPEGSTSKLSTWRDGIRILATIFFLFKEARPFRFFGALSCAFALLSIVLAYPLVTTFLETGLVPRLPTAILTTGIMLIAFLMLASGIVLDSVSRGRREAKRMHYLAIPPVDESTPASGAGGALRSVSRGPPG